MRESFDDFMKRRAHAAAKYVTGDSTEVEALSTTTGQATFFDPGGGFTEGVTAVHDAFRMGAQSFGRKSTSTLEVKDEGASDDLAFWTGFQDANVELVDSGRIMPMKIRVTEIFRRVDDEWRMVHRHASIAKK